MSRQEPKNTLQQDLFLVAKSHYKSESLSRIDMAKRICAVHILSEWSYFKTQDVAYWLMKEFVEAELILTNRLKLTTFMMEHGKYALDLGGNPLQPKANVSYREQYMEILVNELLSQISLMPVLRDGEWSMPFDKPEVDPYIQGLLDTPVEA